MMVAGPRLGTLMGTLLPMPVCVRPGRRAWRPARHLGAPVPERYAGQRIFVVRGDDYVYLLPFVEDEHTVFLKTIIPSRKATKQYFDEEADDHEDRRR